MAKSTLEKKGKAVAAKGLDLIGDPKAGRPVLGGTATVAMFRSLRLIGVMEGLDDTLGKDSRALVYNSGKHFGGALGLDILQETGPDLGLYVPAVAERLKDLGVGLMSVVQMDLAAGTLTVRVDECITCAGMPNIGKAVCHFEGGMVSGVLEAFLGAGKKAAVEESKCWALGDRTCQFEVRIS